MWFLLANQRNCSQTLNLDALRPLSLSPFLFPASGNLTDKQARQGWQHCRLSICSYFGWLWQILRQTGSSRCHSRPRVQDRSAFLLILHQKDMKKLILAKSETNRTTDQILVLFLLDERGLIPCCAYHSIFKSLGEDWPRAYCRPRILERIN